MAYDFRKLLSEGNEAADNHIANEKQIEGVLSEFENSLHDFLQVDVKFRIETEYAEVSLKDIMRPRVKTGYKSVEIYNEETSSGERLFRYKISDGVYPVMLEIDTSHVVCNNQDDFANALGQVASNAKIHLKLKSFKNFILRANEQKPLKN